MKKKFLNIFLDIIAVILVAILMITAFNYSPSINAKTVSASTNMNILTVSNGAKAEDGKLTFRYWINKRALQDYVALVPMHYTYFNVSVNGTLDNNLSHFSSGLNYTEWEYNLSNESNVGFGYFDVIIDVVNGTVTPTDKITVIFGYSNGDTTHIDLFSNTVSYADVYYAPESITELETQITFLESELARVGAESATNYQSYLDAQEELKRLQIKYDQLKGAKTEGVLEKTFGCNSTVTSTLIPAVIVLAGACAILGGKRYAKHKKKI